MIGADSFWVDGYFEENTLGNVRDGDPVRIQLMGYAEELHGHVDSVSHGIAVPNVQPGEAGLALVNPIFTWVRLAQRVPVRVDFDAVPGKVRLVAGTTATLRIERAGGAGRPQAGRGDDAH